MKTPHIKQTPRRGLLALLGINLAIAASLTFTPPANAAKIGMCVSTVGNTFDLAWSARLTNQGHTVIIVPQATTAATVAAANYDLLIVSSDVTSGGFRTGPGISQSVPYLVYENALYGDFFGGGGGTFNGNTITITNTSNPLAASLSGAQIIATGTPQIPVSQGARSANCTLVATYGAGNDISLLCLEPYLSNGTTSFSARRIGVPVYANWTSNQVTAAGWQILDGAVAYGLTAPPPPPTKTWNGAGDGVAMTSGANWVGGVAPVASDRLIFGGSTGLAPNNDLPSNMSFNGILFTNGAGAFTISGNDITIFSGITNKSANPQTILVTLTNSAANVYNAANADLIHNGIMRNNQVVKEGTNALWLMGTAGNTGLGGTVNNGTLILAKVGGVFALTSGTTVNTNGILRIYGPGTDQIQYDQRVTLNGGVFQVANTNGLVSPSFEEIGSLSGANSTISVVENGLADSTNTLVLGGGFGGKRGIYAGIMRDGAGVFNFAVGRGGNSYIFNGTHTYSGTTTMVNNDNAAGPSRIILNGTHVGGGAYSFVSNDGTRGALLGGTGIISATVADFNDNSLISPGGNFTADTNNAPFLETTGILTISNAVNLNTATATLDVQLNSTTVGSGYDQVNIAGSGTFSNNSANLKVTVGFTPATGNKFTIVKVQGTDPTNNVGVFASLSGVATDLSQGAIFVDPITGKLLRISYRAEGSTFDAGEGLGNDIMLEVVAPVGAKDLVWRGDLNNAWDITTTANWRTTGGVSSTFTNGDFVTFNDSGSNSVPLDLASVVTPATFQFDATKNYVLAGAGKFSGVVILTKTNTGTLSIVTDNDNTGSTIINQGAVQMGTNGTTGTLAGSLTINTNGTFVHNRSDDLTFATAFTGSGSFVHAGSGALTLPNNLAFDGRTTNRGGLLQLGTGVGTAGSIGGDVNVGSTNVLRYYYDGNVTIGNSRSGNGTVIYETATGNRSFTLPATVLNTNFSGSNYVGVGVTLKTINPNPGYSFGNGGSVYVADLAQAYLDGTSVPYNQEFFLQGDGWTGDSPALGAMRIYQCTVSGPVHLLANTRIGGSFSGGTISGKIDGAFQLEVFGTINNFVLSLGPTNGPNTYGSTLVTSNAVRALNSGGISAGPLTVDVNGAVHVFGNNVTVANLNNGVNGGGAIYNMSTATNGTLTVGTDGTSTSFDGFFANGASRTLGLTKVGAGTLTLSAANTSSGDVTVNGGTLALTGSGSFGNASNLLVGTGATLDVSARGDTTLALNANQTLKHSGASTGPITVTGNLNLGSGALLLAINRSGLAHDSLAVSGSTTISGTLAVTNIGAMLQVGDSFQLFPGATPGFAAFSLPVNDYTNNVIYGWNNTVSSDGKITVASVTPMVNTNAPQLQVSASGNTLSLAWPTNKGWTLLTNSVSLTVTNQWFPYPNSANLTNVNIPMDPTKTNVFFKMQYPYP
jgi:autotransporter-associated beta strand protein